MNPREKEVDFHGRSLGQYPNGEFFFNMKRYAETNCDAVFQMISKGNDDDLTDDETQRKARTSSRKVVGAAEEVRFDETGEMSLLSQKVPEIIPGVVKRITIHTMRQRTVETRDIGIRASASL